MRAALAFLPLLAACTALGPDPLGAPAPTVPASFVGASSARPVAPAPAFWREYRDPMLNELVTRGLAQSLDILAAQERIRAAAADLRGQDFTGISGTASASHNWQGSPTSDRGSASLGAGYVFDIFGGAFRARQASEAALTASTAAAEATRQAWLAEVISAYGSARHYQQALAVTRQTIRSRERTVQITRDKVEIGTATGLELIQVQAQLDAARADLPSNEAQFNAQVFRLATLMDEPAAPLLSRMQRGAAPLRIPAGPSAGVPADLLRNRPDLRQAEQALVQALAAVGIAEAALLPSLTLSGSITGSNTWSLGPQLSLPVLTQPALRATRERRLAEARAAEIAWRAAVMNAVENVQTALSNLQRSRVRISALEAALRGQEQAHELATASFEAGTITLLELLDVDRTRASARASVLSARHEAAQQWAVLNIALGAGRAQ